MFIEHIMHVYKKIWNIYITNISKFDVIKIYIAEVLDFENAEKRKLINIFELFLKYVKKN